MTAEEKIAQAERVLNKLAQADPWQDEFYDEMSAFLSASQSILYHLLAEYAGKFSLVLEDVNASAFLAEARRTNNQKALDFIKWYNCEYERLLKQKFYGFLVKKRHNDIHRQSERPKNIMPMGPVTLTTGPNGEKVPHQEQIWLFDESIAEFDTLEPMLNSVMICKMFLMHLTGLVHEARKFQ